MEEKRWKIRGDTKGLQKRPSRRERGKETLRESKRSGKHETCISLSIMYALNPGIYASGINVRARLAGNKFCLKHVHAVRLCIYPRRKILTPCKRRWWWPETDIQSWFSSDNAVYSFDITGNRRANIGSMGKCMKAGYRLLSGFTTPSRHTSAIWARMWRRIIFLFASSRENYTLWVLSKKSLNRAEALSLRH